jgi:MFS family permease
MAGLVSSYEGLLAVRFLLGLLEGPMFSGIVLYLSEGFYTRRDLSLRYVSSFALYRSTYGWSLTLFRISYFFSAASVSAPPFQLPSLHMLMSGLLCMQLSGAFSGLLAAAISKMDGIGGKDGWAWIFILVGALL